MNFRELIARAHITKHLIAEEVGVTVNTIHLWENGKTLPHLTPAQYQRLATILESDSEELATAFPDENNNPPFLTPSQYSNLIKTLGCCIDDLTIAFPQAIAPELRPVKRSRKPIRKVTNESKPRESVAKRYLITHPKGEVEEITNLSAFCREFNLHQAQMHLVANGKITHHKGFKVQRINEQLLKVEEDVPQV